MLLIYTINIILFCADSSFHMENHRQRFKRKRHYKGSNRHSVDLRTFTYLEINFILLLQCARCHFIGVYRYLWQHLYPQLVLSMAINSLISGGGKCNFTFNFFFQIYNRNCTCSRRESSLSR